MDKAADDTLSGENVVPHNSTVVSSSGSQISPTIKALLFSVCSVCILLIITLVVCLVYKCCFVRRRGRRPRARPNNEPPKSYDTVRAKILGKVRDSLSMALTTRSREALVRNCAQDGVCSICLDSYLNQRDSPDAKLGILKKCNHFFHFDCVWRWLEKNTSCPICRKSMSINTKHILAIPVSAVTRSLPPMKSSSLKYGSKTKSTISSLNSSEHGSGVRNTIEKTRNQQTAMAASVDSIQGIYAKNVNCANKQNRPLPPTPDPSSRVEDETSVSGKDEPVYVEVEEYNAMETNNRATESVLTVSDETVCARGSGDFGEDRIEPNLVVSTKACLNFEEPEPEEEAVVEFLDEGADDTESAQNSNKINSVREGIAKLKKEEQKTRPVHSTHRQSEAGENKLSKKYDTIHPKEKARDDDNQAKTVHSTPRQSEAGENKLNKKYDAVRPKEKPHDDNKQAKTAHSTPQQSEAGENKLNKKYDEVRPKEKPRDDNKQAKTVHSTPQQSEAGENKLSKKYDEVRPKEKARDDNKQANKTPSTSHRSSTSAPSQEHTQLSKVPAASSEICNVHGHVRENQKPQSRPVSSSGSSSASKSSNGKEQRRSEPPAVSNAVCEVHGKRNSSQEQKKHSNIMQHPCPEHQPSRKETPSTRQVQRKETGASTKRQTPKQPAPAPPSGGGKTQQQPSGKSKAIHGGRAAVAPPPGTNIVGIAHGQAEIVYPFFASQNKIAASSSKTSKQHR